MFDLKTYFDIVNPKTFRETIAREAKNKDNRGTLINLAVASFMVTLASIILSIIAPASLNTGRPAGTATYIAGFILGIVFPYFSIISISMIAKMLGGKGKPENFGHVCSTVQVSLAAFVFVLLMAVAFSPPIAQCLLFMVLMAAGIYIIYIYYTIIRAVHPTISTFAAAGTLMLGFVALIAFWGLTAFIRLRLGV